MRSLFFSHSFFFLIYFLCFFWLNPMERPSSMSFAQASEHNLAEQMASILSNLFLSILSQMLAYSTIVTVCLFQLGRNLLHTLNCKSKNIKRKKTNANRRVSNWRIKNGESQRREINGKNIWHCLTKISLNDIFLSFKMCFSRHNLTGFL